MTHSSSGGHVFTAMQRPGTLLNAPLGSSRPGGGQSFEGPQNPPCVPAKGGWGVLLHDICVAAEDMLEEEKVAKAHGEEAEEGHGDE